MATYTSYHSLKKPADSDTYDIADANGNTDIIESVFNAEEKAIAIVSTANTHGAIAAGEFVYIRGHASLSEGLYKARSAIAANGTLSTTNVESVSNGGLNALNSNISNISNITLSHGTGNGFYSLQGKVCTFSLQITASETIGSVTFASGLPTPKNSNTMLLGAEISSSSGQLYYARVDNGNIIAVTSISSGKSISFSGSYIVN